MNFHKLFSGEIINLLKRETNKHAGAVCARARGFHSKLEHPQTPPERHRLLPFRKYLFSKLLITMFMTGNFNEKI